MSDSSPSSGAANILFAVGLFVVFGFLVVIFSGSAGNESIEEKAYMGDFDQATIDARWENLEVIEKEQAEAYSSEKVAEAMVAVAGAKSEPAKSGIVVPGSPTFMKQMEAQSQPAPEPEPAPQDPAGAEAPKAKEDAPPAPKPEAKPAPEDKPKAAPKAEGKAAPKKGTPAPAPKAEAPKPANPPAGQ